MRLPGFTALVLVLLAAANLPAVPDRPGKKKKVDPVKEELKKLQGTWVFTNLEFNGRQYAANQFGAKFGNPTLVIKGNQLTCQSRGQTTSIALKADPKKTPKEITAVPVIFGAGGARPGIYVLTGDTLKICLPRIGNQRPGNFNTNGTRTYVVTWTRSKS
jgi:uncharacterized protein (TIGR03067 family)